MAIKLHSCNICNLVACIWPCYELQSATVWFLSVSTDMTDGILKNGKDILSTQNDRSFWVVFAVSPMPEVCFGWMDTQICAQMMSITIVIDQLLTAKATNKSHLHIKEHTINFSTSISILSTILVEEGMGGLWFQYRLIYFINVSIEVFYVYKCRDYMCRQLCRYM